MLLPTGPGRVSAARRRALVVGGLLLTAGVAYLILTLLDPGGGPADLPVDPMPGPTPTKGGQDGELSAEPPRVPLAPRLRVPDRVAEPFTKPDGSGADPASATAPELTVHDESGEPAVGVSVTVKASGWSGAIDESGALQLPRDASVSKVSVSGPAFEAVDLVRPTGLVRVVLVGTGVLEGHARDVYGAAVTGARVFVVRPGGRTPVPDRPEWAAVTGSDGAFRLTRLPPGKWEVRARLDPQDDGHALEASHACVMPGARELVLILERARDIRGRITGPDGKPAPGKLSVAMRGVRPDGGNGDAWFGTVAEDGTFVISGVGSGANELWAWTSDRGSRMALTTLHDVPPGTDDMHIELEIGDVIEGSLVDDRGDPVKGRGWLYAFHGDELVNGVNLANAGAFRSYLLPRDRAYDVTLLSASGWSGTASGVAAGTSDLIVRGRLMPPLTGTVLLPDGSSAGAGVEVHVRAVGIGADERPGTAVRLRTDAEGRFSVPRLADLPYVVTASGGSKYAPSRVRGTVQPGADVQLHLQLPERLTGSVMLASSEPAVGQILWVVPEDGVSPGWPVKTDKLGHFNLANLPAVAVRFMLDTLDGAVEVGRAMVPAEDVVITLPPR